MDMAFLCLCFIAAFLKRGIKVYLYLINSKNAMTICKSKNTPHLHPLIWPHSHLWLQYYFVSCNREFLLRILQDHTFYPANLYFVCYVAFKGKKLTRHLKNMHIFGKEQKYYIEIYITCFIPSVIFHY